jgi:hypothetical protein
MQVILGHPGQQVIVFVTKRLHGQGGQPNVAGGVLQWNGLRERSPHRARWKLEVW